MFIIVAAESKKVLDTEGDNTGLVAGIVVVFIVVVAGVIVVFFLYRR